VGELYSIIAKAMGRAPLKMLYLNPCSPTPRPWLLALRSLLKAFLDSSISNGTVHLSDCAYILDGRVVKGPLVRRGYVPSRREICEGKGD
jgi:hypothetical protein